MGVLAAVTALATSLALVACESETGPDAPPRENGCIDLGCTTPPPTDTEPGDAGPDDAG